MKAEELTDLGGSVQRPTLLSPIMDLIRRLWKKDPKAAAALAAGQHVGILPKTTRSLVMEKKKKMTKESSLAPKLQKDVIPGGVLHHYRLASITSKKKLAFKSELASVPTPKMVKAWKLPPVKKSKSIQKRHKLKVDAEDWFKHDSPFSVSNAPEGKSITLGHYKDALKEIEAGNLRTRVQVRRFLNSKVKIASISKEAVPVSVIKAGRALRTVAQQGEQTAIRYSPRITGSATIQEGIKDLATWGPRHPYTWVSAALRGFKEGAHSSAGKALQRGVRFAQKSPLARQAYRTTEAGRTGAANLFGKARTSLPPATWGPKQWEQATTKLSSIRRFRLLSKLAEKKTEKTRITGKGEETPQGVGYRKKFFAAKGKVAPRLKAVAVNDPRERAVIVHGDRKDARLQKVLKRTSQAVKKEQGWGTKGVPMKGKGSLKKTTFSKAELDATTGKQGYGEYLKAQGITPTPGHKFYPQRYGLKHIPEGPDYKALQSRPERWEGSLSKKQISQLKGKSPMYAKQYEQSSGLLHKGRPLGAKVKKGPSGWWRMAKKPTRMKPDWSAGRQMADEFTMSLERPSVLKRLSRSSK